MLLAPPRCFPFPTGVSTPLAQHRFICSCTGSLNAAQHAKQGFHLLTHLLTQGGVGSKPLPGLGSGGGGGNPDG
jgi:hypothetical protein